MPPTIKDVAKMAGVSIATVSRVLNGKDRVKDETKEKILSAISELSYVTNQSARNLRCSSSNTIGVIVPDMLVPFYTEIIKGIENKSNEFNYKLVVCDSQSNIGKEKAFIKYLYDGSIDGMIFVDPYLFEEDISEIKQKEIPVAVLGHNMEMHNIPSITIDNKLGAYKAVKHLVSHGYKRIAFIGGTKAEHGHDHQTNERFDGYREALVESGMEIDKAYIDNGQYCEEGGSRAFLNFMTMENRPDAIFCANDEMAFGVLRTAKKCNIGIPRDMGLIGFDNVRICQYTDPLLTTVNGMTYNMGLMICEKLMFQIENRGMNVKNTNLVLKPELIIRESCGC